jgi:hypothetical protein
MKRNRVILVIGLTGAAALATGCGDSDVRKYLGTNGGPKGLYEWEKYVNGHLCLLEQYSTIPNAQKLCTQTPPTVTPPPSYPPK